MEYQIFPNASSDYFKEPSTADGVRNPIEECGLYLETYIPITKGKRGLDAGCRRFIGICCDDLQDAVISSVDPQVSCLKKVQKVVCQWSDEEGIEVDLNNLVITFDRFWWVSTSRIEK